MSLNNIQLPGFLYQKMFKNNLVDLKQDKERKGLKKESEFNFLGGNEKKIIFLSRDSQNKYLADPQMKFLNDLLAACQLTTADIAFVNFFQNNTITYRELISQLNPKKILLFGVTALELDLPFAIPFFQIQNFQEQVYMISPSLEELQMNKELKKQLWMCFQKLFNVQKQK